MRNNLDRARDALARAAEGLVEETFAVLQAAAAKEAADKLAEPKERREARAETPYQGDA